MMYHMTERVSLRGNGVDTTVGAHILEAKTSSPELGEQAVSTGGNVAFVIHKINKVSTLQAAGQGVEAEFLRTRPGVKYNIKSVEPVDGDRYLRIDATRGN